MRVQPGPLDPRILDILEAYSKGELSAANAAFAIQERGIPGLEDPSASEVILWSKQAGFGIPDPGAETAEADAARISGRMDTGRRS